MPLVRQVLFLKDLGATTLALAEGVCKLLGLLGRLDADLLQSVVEAFEQPELFVEDVRAFFSTSR